MREVLIQTKVKYKYQKQFSKIEDRIYDFYLNSHNAIIETHGDQHYPDGKAFQTCGGDTYEIVHANDIYKKRLAKKKYGIKRYVVVDCRKSNFDYIKNSIINNPGINKILDLSLVDWDKVAINSSHSMIKECGDLWNLGYNAGQIASIIGYSSSSINYWLKYAYNYGMCTNYSKEEAQRRHGKKCINIDTLECFWSLKECCDWYELEYTKMPYLISKNKTNIKRFDDYVKNNKISQDECMNFFINHLIDVKVIMGE